MNAARYRRGRGGTNANHRSPWHVVRCTARIAATAGTRGSATRVNRLKSGMPIARATATATPARPTADVRVAAKARMETAVVIDRAESSRASTAEEAAAAVARAKAVRAREEHAPALATATHGLTQTRARRTCGAGAKGGRKRHTTRRRRSREENNPEPPKRSVLPPHANSAMTSAKGANDSAKNRPRYQRPKQESRQRRQPVWLWPSQTYTVW